MRIEEVQRLQQHLVIRKEVLTDRPLERQDLPLQAQHPLEVTIQEAVAVIIHPVEVLQVEAMIQEGVHHLEAIVASTRDLVEVPRVVSTRDLVEALRAVSTRDLAEAHLLVVHQVVHQEVHLDLEEVANNKNTTQ